MRLLDECSDGVIKLVKDMGKWRRGLSGERGIAGAQAGSQDGRIGLGKEQGNTTAFGGDDVPIPIGETLDKTFATEAAEIVRHARGRVGLGLGRQQRGDPTAELAKTAGVAMMFDLQVAGPNLAFQCVGPDSIPVEVRSPRDRT